MTATILLVDDEPHVTSVLKHRLASMGFHVVTACDGRSALNLAREVRPAVICSDLQMPGMSGLELARMLLTDQSTASIPMILLSARGYIVSQLDLELPNLVQRFDKPFSPRKVAAAIAGMLGSSDRSEAA